ncbi:MAG: aspartate aminotransferase family protein [Actinomycetota bacterium]
MTFVPLPGEAAVMPTYARYPVTLVRGEGTTTWDDQGRAYLDMTGGIGALSLGHCHPDWVAAVTEAVGTIGLVSNLYATPPQAELAARLASLLPIPDARVFFCNSGAEANEAAIKLIRARGLALGTPAIVALDGSFHGRTVAALAATGQPAKRAPFEPLVDWFRFVPPGDPGALRAAFAAGDVGGVLLEPVMGEGGVRPLDDAYLRLARELCDEHGALFVVDEVQSGFRCGDWLAISHAGVTPDAACLAKALGGGLPIGAFVARADIAFGPGEHATTYGGGPVPSSAALAVLDVIERDGLLERSLEIGARLTAAVVTAAPTGAIAEIRGRGCLWGFELAPVADGTPADANAVVLRMLQDGVLASIAGPSVVRMSPPLTTTDADVDRAAESLGAALATSGVPA